MKRTVVLSVVALAFAAGIVLGAAAPKLKFPWAGEELNKPCGKTMLEWKCMEARVVPGSQPIRLAFPNGIASPYVLNSLELEPMPEGLLIRADVGYLKPLPDLGKEKPHHDIPAMTDIVLAHIRKHVLPQHASRARDDYRDMCIILSIEGKGSHTRNADGIK